MPMSLDFIFVPNGSHWSEMGVPSTALILFSEALLEESGSSMNAAKVFSSFSSKDVKI